MTIFESCDSDQHVFVGKTHCILQSGYAVSNFLTPHPWIATEATASHFNTDISSLEQINFIPR